MTRRDPTLDVLLDLDGQVLVVDPEGGYWVRFIVTRVPVSQAKPHGIDYSLTLHGPGGERLVGFDNAHLVAKQKRGQPQDQPASGTNRFGVTLMGQPYIPGLTKPSVTGPTIICSAALSPSTLTAGRRLSC